MGVISLTSVFISPIVFFLLVVCALISRAPALCGPGLAVDAAGLRLNFDDALLHVGSQLRAELAAILGVDSYTDLAGFLLCAAVLLCVFISHNVLVLVVRNGLK